MGPRAVLTVWAFSVCDGAASSQREGRRKELVTNHSICTLVSTGKSKKEDSAKEEKRKRDVPAQLKAAKPTQGGKSQQLLQAQQPTAPQAQQGGFSAHKEIKLTLLNKVRAGVAAVPCAQGSEGWGPAAGPRAGKGSSGASAVRMSSAGRSAAGIGEAADRTCLAAHTLRWLGLGTVLAAPLGRIPAAASRAVPCFLEGCRCRSHMC